MKHILIAAVIALTSSTLLAQQPPKIVSPEVAADRRVTFRLYAPQAHDVTVSGEFMQGSKKFEKAENGVWSVTVGPIDPEIYFYNFTVDGVKTIDFANPNLKTGSTGQTITSALEVKGPAPAFY